MKRISREFWFFLAGFIVSGIALSASDALAKLTATNQAWAYLTIRITIYLALIIIGAALARRAIT